MFGPEPRPIVRHRAPRRRLGAVVRPYPVVVAGLVTLVSVPVLAAVLVGSASVTPTSGSRSPLIADPSEDPVVVPGPGTAGISPSTAPTDLPSPSLTPTPVIEGLSPTTTAAAMAGSGKRPCPGSQGGPGGSGTQGGFGAGPRSTPRRTTPAPRPSTIPPGGGTTVSPLPAVPPVPPAPVPGVPGILPTTPVPLLPPLLPGVVPGVGGVVGGLLGVLA